MANTKTLPKTKKNEISAETWTLIEADYRSGLMSNRQIAAKHNCGETIVRNKAKLLGWKKDLANAIRARALELVRTQDVRADVRNETTDAQIVEDNAHVQANVIIAHQKRIVGANATFELLMQKLDGSVVNAAEFEELAELLAAKRTAHMTDPVKQAAEQDRLMAIFTKFMQLPTQAGVFKQLTDSLKTLIAAEREAYGIDGKQSVGETIEELLEKLAEEKNQ